MMADLDENVTRRLSDMADRSDDLRPLWRRVASEVWVPRQKQVPTRLPALSRASVRRKRHNKAVPLVDTGALLEATYKYAPVKESGDEATFGIPKGNKHRGLGGMHAVASGSRPRRDIVPSWLKAENEEYLELTSEWIMDGD